MSSGLRLFTGIESENKISPKLYGAAQVLISLVLYLGSFLSLMSMIGFGGEKWIAAGAGVLVILIIHRWWKTRGIVYSVTGVVAGFFVIGFLMDSRFVVEGCLAVLNQAIDAAGCATGNLYDTFQLDLPRTSYVLYETLFLVLAGAVAAVLCAVIVKGNMRIFTVLLLLPIGILAGFFGLTPGLGYGVLLLAGIFLTWAYSDIPAVSGRLLAAAGLIPAAALILAFVVSLCHAEGATSPVTDWLEHDRYLPDRLVNDYPEGHLTQIVPASETDNDIVLEVTMEHPQPMYLRGFVGSRYKDGLWYGLDNKTVYENQGLFYWLHQDGFYGYDQLASVDIMTGSGGATYGVSVRNSGASAKYLYTPYELVNGQELEQVRQLTDGEFVSDADRGARQYSYQVTAPLYEASETLGMGIFQKQQENDPDALAYMENEAYYNTFVYDTYTALDEDSRDVIGRALGGTGQQADGSHMAYEDAVALVTSYLGQLTYSEEQGSYAGPGSFLEHVLLEEKTGSDIHFAAAATIMFRYLGIPARYVEGYTVTAGDAEKMTAGSAYGLSQDHAHAWTEIYYDTIGWLPVEVTPGYKEQMNSAPAAEDGDDTYQQDGVTVDTDMSVNTAPGSAQRAEGNTFHTVLICALTVIGLLLACGILVAGRCIYIRRKRKASVENADRTEAVRAIYRYMEQMTVCDELAGSDALPEHYFGKVLDEYGRLDREKFLQSFEICQQAAFAGRPVTEEQYRQVADCARQMRAAMIGDRTVSEKIYWNLWKCL